jgi:membrane protease YdiL (CAAX protease family)
MPNVAWKFYDVLIVMLVVSIGIILISFLMLALLGDSNLASRFARYTSSLFVIIFIFSWIKIKYGLTKEALGIRKPNSSILLYTIVIMMAVLIYYLLIRLHLINVVSISNFSHKSYSITDYILLPLSIIGFASIVLTPITEEIFMRGFVYGYLRQRTGVISALLIQALIFSLYHYGIDNDVTSLFIIWFIGLILGILYEITGSLYPSMVFHGVYNYIALIYIALPNR